MRTGTWAPRRQPSWTNSNPKRSAPSPGFVRPDDIPLTSGRTSLSGRLFPPSLVLAAALDGDQEHSQLSKQETAELHRAQSLAQCEPR
jgi:hypothetical protein